MNLRFWKDFSAFARSIVPKISFLPRDLSANVAVLTALCALPMFGMIGIAVDYGVALNTKAVLDAAADAAVVAAITTAESVIWANAGTSNGTEITRGKAQALATFNANAGSLKLAALPTPTINITRTGQVLTASVTYAANSRNSFGQLFNIATSSVTGSTGSSLQMPSYNGVYIALDASQSMGIGASQTDMNNLYALTQNLYGSGNGCVFGCHVPTGSQTVSNEHLAHTNNIKLRIDVVRSDIKQLITNAIGSENGQKFYKIGLYTISGGGSPTTVYGLNTLIDATTDLTAVQTAAGQIDLGPNVATGIGDTNFYNALDPNSAGTTQDQPFPYIVPASGDGTSLAKSINYAIIITDGVQDLACNTWIGHCTQAFDPSVCTALKNKGITVIVLYTTYIPFPNESTYQVLVAPIASKIQPHLLACASSAADFIQASDTSSLATSFQQIFAILSNSAHITN